MVSWVALLRLVILGSLAVGLSAGKQKKSKQKKIRADQYFYYTHKVCVAHACGHDLRRLEAHQAMCDWGLRSSSILRSMESRPAGSPLGSTGRLCRRRWRTFVHFAPVSMVWAR